MEFRLDFILCILAVLAVNLPLHRTQTTISGPEVEKGKPFCRAKFSKLCTAFSTGYFRTKFPLMAALARSTVFSLLNLNQLDFLQLITAIRISLHSIMLGQVHLSSAIPLDNGLYETTAASAIDIPQSSAVSYGWRRTIYWLKCPPNYKNHRQADDGWAMVSINSDISVFI